MIEKEKKAKIIDGAKIIILSPDKILLFHRDNIPTIRSPDCWQLVGGGIEEGETPEQGLIREVKEEVSYDLKDFKFLFKKVGSLGEFVFVYVTFVEKDEENKFTLGSGEGQGIGWFTIDEALAIKLSPGTRAFLIGYRDLIEKMMKTRTVLNIEKYKEVVLDRM
jgi:8-oxo-dGTP pyrophosphatase MutT (NUDIX family)